jgi:hydroxymethylbilane synthase
MEAQPQFNRSAAKKVLSFAAVASEPLSGRIKANSPRISNLSMSTPTTIRIGTRASALAQWQANFVADELRARGAAVELVLIRTTGDIAAGPLGTIGGQGLFTKELQRALLDDVIDVAVHSLKDLPTDEVPGLVLGAVPRRAAAGDALVSNRFAALEALPPGSRLGTGSARRKSQLLWRQPAWLIFDIRGNVDTRLRKLDDGEYDAIILAEAGLTRLGLAERIAQVISPTVMLPAVGQGALGLECRAGDAATRSALAPLDDPPTRAAIIAERTLLATLRGGCLAPIGAWGRIEGGELQLDAMVLNAAGTERRTAQGRGAPASAAALGQRLADELLAAGAGQLIAESRTGP